MKPVFLQISHSLEESFKVSLDEGPFFYTPLHFHFACQLTLILKSQGTRFVGDNIERFEEGDMVFIGSNLPHVFRNDPAYYEKNAGMKASAVHTFFAPDFLGDLFMDLPETTGITQLIHQAKRGIKITGVTRNTVREKVLNMLKVKGFERLLELLNILHILSVSPDLEFLSNHTPDLSLKKSDSHKINDVFNYVMDQYAGPIKLDEVAAIANMTPTAFCRYFKRSTRKTFSQFLTEIRVGHACKLLVEENYPVSEIGFLSGFHNVSNFNRRFKEVTGHTPKEYRSKQYS